MGCRLNSPSGVNLVYNVHQRRGCELEYEWYPRKAERNLCKHGVEFVDAVMVFDDDRAVTLMDEHPSEERYVTFGSDAHGRVVGDLLHGTRECHSDNLCSESNFARARSIRG